jgi:hypothetical protein
MCAGCDSCVNGRGVTGDIAACMLQECYVFISTVLNNDLYIDGTM